MNYIQHYAQLCRYGVYHLYTNTPSAFSNFADAYLAALLWQQGWIPLGNGFIHKDGVRTRGPSALMLRQVTRDAVFLFESNLFADDRAVVAGYSLALHRQGLGDLLSKKFPNADKMADIAGSLGQLRLYCRQGRLSDSLRISGGRAVRLPHHPDLK